MTAAIEINWKWREHWSGDVGKARFKCFDLSIQDMDGDAASWSVRRGDMYVAAGEEDDTDKAVEKVKEVVGYLYRGIEINDFKRENPPRSITPKDSQP